MIAICSNNCYREFAFLCCSGCIHPSSFLRLFFHFLFGSFSFLFSLSFPPNQSFELRNGGKKKGGEMAGRGNSTTLFFIRYHTSRAREIALWYRLPPIATSYTYRCNTNPHPTPQEETKPKPGAQARTMTRGDQRERDRAKKQAKLQKEAKGQSRVRPSSGAM